MKTFERICWFWCSGGGFCGAACSVAAVAGLGVGARVLDAAAGLGVNAAPATSLSGPLWGRAGANAAAAGLGVNVAPARGLVRSSTVRRRPAARARLALPGCTPIRLRSRQGSQGWPDHSEVEPTNRNKLGLKSVHRGVRTCDGKRTSWAPSSPPSIRSRK